MIDNTKGSLDVAKGDVYAATDRIKTACVNYDSAAASLKSSVDNLINALESASEKIEAVNNAE